MSTDRHGTVAALRPPPISLRRLEFHERVLVSMWFVPSLFAVAALALSGLTLWIDSRQSFESTWLPVVSAGAAETLSATVAAGMLTFTGVVFSTTLVAIQLAGGQYSPRVVRVFVRSPLVHVALGVFVATFVVALNALIETRDGSSTGVPALTVTALYVMMMATLATFIAFSHGIVRLLRVQYLLNTVTTHGRQAIESFVPTADAYRQAPAPVRDPSGSLVRNGDRVGVVMAIDVRSLTDVAAAQGAWIELLVQPGEYLGRGAPVARVHGAALGGPRDDQLARCFLLGGERTLVQDPGFAIRQLVDIASRALSPAINDPTTAVQAIDRITDLLATLARRPDASGFYLDEVGAVRVSVPEPDFARSAALAYTEISLFGADSPQVVRRLLAAYAELEELTEGPRRGVIADLRRRTLAGVEGAMPAAFLEASRESDHLGLG